MTPTIIAGAGGFGREVLRLLTDTGKFRVDGWIDNDPEKIGTSISGLPVLGGDGFISDLPNRKSIALVIAIGERITRERLFNHAISLGYQLPRLVHPGAYLAPEAEVAPGVIVYPGAVVMPGCRLHKGVLVNTGVSLGHDATVGAFSNLNPGVRLGGWVDIGRRVMVGIGASILDHIHIGDDAVVGGGALVANDVHQRSIVTGVPASSHSKEDPVTKAK